MKGESKEFNAVKKIRFKVSVSSVIRIKFRFSIKGVGNISISAVLISRTILPMGTTKHMLINVFLSI